MSRYLELLPTVAASLANQTLDLEDLYAKMHLFWKVLESDAESHGYDIFHASSWKARNSARSLCALLFKVPNCGTHEEDVAQLLTKDAEYGASWIRRGGVGAFMMGARKWDRIETQVGKAGSFQGALLDTRPNGIRDDIGDLRRYILLWLSYDKSRESPGLTRQP